METPQQNNSTQPIPVSVTVAGLLTDDETSNPVVVLKDTSSERVLLMWVGDVEAVAIDLAIRKTHSERPRTHQLLLGVITGMEGVLERVVIDRVEKGTYFASLHIRTKTGFHVIDSRPSDAIVLAILSNRPLLIDRDVFNKASTVLKPSDIPAVPPVAAQIDISISFIPPAIEDTAMDEAPQATQLQNTILPPRTQRSVDARAMSPEELKRIKKQLLDAQLREQSTD